MFRLFIIVMFALYVQGTQHVRQAKDEDEDMFNKWLEAISGNFDKDWEDFMKEAETAAAEANKERRRREVSPTQQLFIDSMKQFFAMRPSDATDDARHKLFQSMQNDMRAEMKVFTNRLSDHMTQEFNTFLETMSAEMAANIEDMAANASPESSRKVQEEYKTKYTSWWGQQLETAYNDFMEYQTSLE